MNEPLSGTILSKNVNSRASMERYLSEHLPDIFFDKTFMTPENNLANKKLTINYDAIFNEIQNEKLISTAGDKDDVFILPDLQLDNLDQLAYCTDDMILTSEILPTLCDQPPCTNNVNTKDFIIRLQETINLISDNNIINKDLGDNNSDDNVMNLENYIEKDFCNDSLSTSAKDSCTNTVSYKKPNKHDSTGCSDLENNEDSYTIESHSLTLQPSDSTRPTRLHIKFKRISTKEKNSIQQKNETLDRIFTRSKKKGLSVVDSLAVKQSKNSIVTNENSKSLKRKLRTDTNDSKKSKQNDSLRVRQLSSYNHQEQVISKALKGVGVTDDKLQHFKSDNNVKVWRCHQDNCDRNFNKLCSLRIHLLTHFGIKPFKVIIPHIVNQSH